jgi:hypothetical protein
MLPGGPAMRLIGIGWFIAICIILGVVGGKQLDKALDTEKLFTVVGIFVGLFFGLWGGWIQLREVLDAINRRRTGDND